jgi:hypothetical protein
MEQEEEEADVARLFFSISNIVARLGYFCGLRFCSFCYASDAARPSHGFDGF